MLIEIIKTSLYLLALINPASKIFLLSSMEPPFTKKALWKVANQATVVAFIILLVITLIGRFLLTTVFHVELYSLKVAGGIVLFLIGFNAIRKGVFYEKSIQDDAGNIAIVPLAAPLIAGPGVITAAISYSSNLGSKVMLPAIVLALLVNLLFMLSSTWIRKSLEHIYAIGPLIRITGLIVASVAVQMILGGAGEWLKITIQTIK